MARIKDRSYNIKSANSKKIKTNPITNTRSLSAKGNIFTFLAVSLGVMVGVLSAMSLVMPMARTAIAADLSNLGKTVQFKTAADNFSGSCVSAPSSSQPAVNNGVMAAKTQLSSSMLASNTAQPTGVSTVQISKVISGVFGNQSATISNTGPQSTNKVAISNEVTTKINNTNDINVTNNNPQTATSGNSSVNTNTSGGNATTGTAKNDSTNNFTFNLNN